jgi:hypothetical protein
MISATRLLSLTLLLLSLGLFVCAKPVDLVDRNTVDKVARGVACSVGCNEGDVLAVFVALRAKIAVYLGELRALLFYVDL